MADHVDKVNTNDVMLSTNTVSVKEEHVQEDSFEEDKVDVSETSITTHNVELQGFIWHDKLKQCEESTCLDKIKTELSLFEVTEVQNDVKVEVGISAHDIRSEFDNGVPYCEHCEAYYEDYCIECGMLVHILNKNALNSVDNGAQKDIPNDILEIQDCFGQTGIYALRIIPASVKLGPFPGLNATEWPWKMKGEKMFWTKINRSIGIGCSTLILPEILVIKTCTSFTLKINYITKALVRSKLVMNYWCILVGNTGTAEMKLSKWMFLPIRKTHLPAHFAALDSALYRIWPNIKPFVLSMQLQRFQLKSLKGARFAKSIWTPRNISTTIWPAAIGIQPGITLQVNGATLTVEIESVNIKITMVNGVPHVEVSTELRPPNEMNLTPPNQQPPTEGLQNAPARSTAPWAEVVGRRRSPLLQLYEDDSGSDWG